MENIRPTIFDYQDMSGYICDMLSWRKADNKAFSIRQETAKLDGCSPSLVTQVAKGNRKLTRDRVAAFASLLEMTTTEAKHLDQLIADNRGAPLFKNKKPTPPSATSTKNHILSDWVNVYVKDAIRLKGFRPDAATVTRILGGVASSNRIKKSFDFLIHEGFFRKNLDGKIVKNDFVTVTTDEIPDKKIRQFHKASLDISKRGLDLYDSTHRQAAATVLPLNKESFEELKSMLKEFQERVTAFAAEHPEDNERLYQVLVHLTPVGGSVNDTH